MNNNTKAKLFLVKYIYEIMKDNTNISEFEDSIDAIKNGGDMSNLVNKIITNYISSLSMEKIISLKIKMRSYINKN